jgi:biopolymer transport protein ExbD
MSFGTNHDADDVMSEINMTPLVDVMLVLLIIFMITIPVMKHLVNVDLPVASNAPQVIQPDTVRLSVDAQGRYYWNEAVVEASALTGLLKLEAARAPQPELHIRGDKAVRYEHVAKAMASAQQAGLRNISFVTEPGQ